ncbi:conserved hypothetical protein [Nitrosococcus halophilus Nc 4]|uniref:DUF3330 domain-containing protein n=1 Tax=Nitrosococcus halophilus (strain Nc4) TaxID=472759 RepID=D5BZ76_NITHN|nr:DUF3330 domain-containing protein [Nitrosococcus halophilus]ADE16090.1 conserved hypothetical protein [Nitrosococcus halophilus Nc 4]
MTEPHDRDPRVFSSEPKLNCEICFKEIPESEAKSHEADEYILWFCGLECYDEWRKAQEKTEEKKEP